jgi:hypothetical protein
VVPVELDDELPQAAMRRPKADTIATRRAMLERVRERGLDTCDAFRNSRLE